jgi:homoserine kinase
MTSLLIEVPATSANLGPGFDSFGLALNLVNRFHVRCNPCQGAHQWQWHPNSKTPEPSGGLPLNAEDNLVLQGALAVFKSFQTKEPNHPLLQNGLPSLSVDLEVNLPLKAGLGSSATALVAGVLLGQHLLNNPFCEFELFQILHSLEGHPDNIGPALLGGVLLCNGNQSYYPLNWPCEWELFLALNPKLSTQTSEARQSLPNAYPLAETVQGLRNASLWTYALFKQDVGAFRQALHDVIHEPYRSAGITDFEMMKSYARSLGALGLVISGSGPTLLGFTTPERRDTVLSGLRQTFRHWTFESVSVREQGATLQTLN